MMEFMGIVSLIVSLIDLYLKNGHAMNHFFVGMILIIASMVIKSYFGMILTIASMIIKSHSEIVQIRKYIGDYKKNNNQEKIDYKEDLDALKEKVEED